MPFFFFDRTIILILIGMAIASLASANMNHTFQKFSKFRSESGYTGADVARFILKKAGIRDVQVEGIRGELTDHYDPSNKVLRLSEPIYGEDTVTAIGVAAHECGHALQDADHYFFMRLRQRIVPVVNIGSQAAFPILILGALMGYNQTLINIGIFLFAFTLIFQLVTLPVEFNASNRALAILSEGNILARDELPYVQKTLRAAALTYVAATIGSALSLLRIVLLFGGNRRD